MKIDRIELHHLSQPLVHPFRTSFGTEAERPCILVAVHSDGLVGWGECVAGNWPGYSYETVQTAWHILRDFLVPPLVGQPLTTIPTLTAHFKASRGHPMAKTSLENALWDLLARRANVPLWQLLGSPGKERVEVGVSIGIQPHLEGLLDRIHQFVETGYRRVKVKIEPGWDVVPLRAIRHKHPDLRLMADANSAYTLADLSLFQQLDELDLLMIEQPLDHDDILDHAKLQARLNTPICLDESIHTPNHARWAIEAGACRIINMKVGRVGGLSHALTIHEICAAHNIPMWCGGMLETGVGRATNLHLATLPNFTLPGDISATDRYYAEDIATPAFQLNPDSTITVPTGPGLGVEVQPDRLEKLRRNQLVWTP